MVFYHLLSIFFALSHLSVCFYVCINSCNKLDLLVNNGISLVLGTLRNAEYERQDAE